MKTALNILAECFVDTLIAKTILFPQKDYTHKKGCNEVIKHMNNVLANQAAFGIIDDDKTIRKFDDFSLLKKHNEQLSIYKHVDKPHYVVKIGKAAEDFILKNAQKCNTELADYGLPSDLEGLKKVTKHINSLKKAETKIKKLFLTLKQNENSDFFKLAQWIDLFKANPYNLDLTII